MADRIRHQEPRRKIIPLDVKSLRIRRIGKGCATALLHDGWHVISTGRREEARELMEKVRKPR